jgi:hypothetical protein
MNEVSKIDVTGHRGMVGSANCIIPAKAGIHGSPHTRG